MKEECSNAMWSKFFKATLVSLLSASLLAFVGPGHAADIKERQLKLAFLPVQQHAIGLGAQKFADLVGEKSGGKVKVKLFPGGALGGDLPVLSALQGGTIEMTILVTSNLVGIIKDFVVLDFPFLFNNENEADTVVNGPAGKKLLDKLPEKGLVGLGYYEFGFRQFSNSKRPITRAEDLQGLKIRVTQNPLFVDFINALGANAVPLAIPELYGAMEQKAVDGIDSPLSFIQLQKYYEVQKHVALTRHLYNAQIVLISKKTWDRLSADERKILQMPQMNPATTSARRCVSKTPKHWNC